MTVPQGLYVHVPFCAIKCAYCDLFSVTGSPDDVRARYVDTLAAEIGVRGTGEPADTIFFGGGTPSLLEPAQVGRILDALRAAFALDPAAEITMEANPETVDETRLRGFRAAGVNRISFGVQSLDPALLKALGRIHSADRARAAVREARAAGFDDLSADLMFGLPGQDVAGWKRDLTEVLSWPLTHLSCYELTIEGDTAFGQHPPALPDEDAVLAQWDTVLDETARAGFNQYEVSNYARPGKECRHNLKYWRDEDWFGFGASAWEAQGGVRRGNPRSLAKYFAGREAGFPPAETDSLPESGRMAETLVLGLRLRAGVDEGEYAARYGADALARYLPALAPHEAAGRVERAEGRLRLTPPGLLVANDVWGDIYEASNS